jgi:hypothetical protein
MSSSYMPGLPRLLLAPIMVAALLFPEVGHGFAHRHAAEHRPTHVADHHHSGGGHRDIADSIAPDDHGHADHPHLDIVANPSARQMLGDVAVVVRVAAVLLADLRETRPVTPVEPTGLSPGDRTHGPPPPSRAPPQV